MPTLPATLHTWETDDFAATLKRELEAMASDRLPLDKAATPGCYIGGERITVSLIRAEGGARALHLHVGVFFTEIVASCGCGDDPVAQGAYCEMRVDIDRKTADARFSIVRD